MSALDDGLKELKQVSQLFTRLSNVVEVFLVGGFGTRCASASLLKCALRQTHALFGERADRKIAATRLQRCLRTKQDITQECLD